MIELRKGKYLSSGLALVGHLDKMLSQEHGYPDEPSWGYAFSYLVALMANNGNTSSFAEKALKFLKLQNMQDPNYPWEFVVYALQHCKRECRCSVAMPIEGYREKGTRMFNWFLLRRLNKKLCETYRFQDAILLRSAINLYQKKTGLILDEFKTRSLQYHAFCLFVLCELLELMPDSQWLTRRILKGVNYSIRQLLPDGTALYLGRGQEQIFGYGAFLYALEYVHHKIQPLAPEVLTQVGNKILSFQREDGSYPLVLRSREAEPAHVNFKSEHPPGWYGYNTLYDYQPFLAFCFFKAAQL